jgi:hypothetical protein
MLLEPKHETIRIVWKDLETRRRYQIGQLSRNDDYQFSYGLEVMDAIKNGFKPLLAFDDLTKTYKSKVLFQSFASRLPDKKRKDIEDILKKYDVNSYDAFEMLKKSGARLPIDSLEFIDPILKDQTDVKRNFFLAGTRHYLGCEKSHDCYDSFEVTKGENLKFAIKVLNLGNEHLGYIPRYYSEEVFKRIKNGNKYEISVKNSWKNNFCDECIFVTFYIQ